MYKWWNVKYGNIGCVDRLIKGNPYKHGVWGGSFTRLHSHSVAHKPSRNMLQRATQNVKYGNIGSVDRQIKGKPL